MLLKILRRKLGEVSIVSRLGAAAGVPRTKTPDGFPAMVLFSLVPSITVLGLAITNPAFGQAATTGESCVPIQEPLQRLACYDSIFDPPSLPELQRNGLWDVRTEKSLLDGRINVFLELLSENVVPVDYGIPQKGKLQIRCLENVTSIRFWIGGNYMSEHGEFGLMTYRIDNADAHKTTGMVTNDNQYIGLPEGIVAIGFVRRLLEAKSLLLSVNPVNRSETPVILTFRIEGLAKAIEPLRQSCSW